VGRSSRKIERIWHGFRIVSSKQWGYAPKSALRAKDRHKPFYCNDLTPQAVVILAAARASMGFQMLFNSGASVALIARIYFFARIGHGIFVDGTLGPLVRGGSV
jgi:hypothetical protein